MPPWVISSYHKSCSSTEESRLVVSLGMKAKVCKMCAHEHIRKSLIVFNFSILFSVLLYQVPPTTSFLVPHSSSSHVQPPHKFPRSSWTGESAWLWCSRWSLESHSKSCQKTFLQCGHGGRCVGPNGIKFQWHSVRPTLSEKHMQHSHTYPPSIASVILHHFPMHEECFFLPKSFHASLTGNIIDRIREPPKETCGCCIPTGMHWS